MFDIWLPLLGGLVLLIVGGELLVRGAVRVATRLGVSPLVIGLTLVGFGTSTPELVTSLQAGLAGAPGIAYGNIVGSNISNILLIVGVSALVFPIAVQSGRYRVPPKTAATGRQAPQGTPGGARLGTRAPFVRCAPSTTHVSRRPLCANRAHPGRTRWALLRHCWLS